MLEEYLARLSRIAQLHPEAKVQSELDHLLKEMLAENGIPYDPIVNESLRSLGFSQVEAGRPDSLFGHVVLDYKDPGTLASGREASKAREQIERYLDGVTGGHSVAPEECQEWAGILWDARHLIFCHSDGTGWRWSNAYETSEASLLTLIQTYRSLHREPLTAALLSRHFGKDSATARALLPALCEHLSHPKHRTNLLFSEWRRLFEQVSTYSLAQLPSLRKWAARNGIASKDASLILFALHTYYSIVVKLLTSEMLASSRTLGGSSIVSDVANAANIEAVFKAFKRLENGDFYRQYRISNFLEGDFFSWYTDENSDGGEQLARGLVRVAKTFQRFEPATPKLKPEAIKDLLKEFYSSLVDEQIRHDIGEYYTPDWLAQYTLDGVGYDGDPGAVVIDPACGSGTFLVECLNRVRAQCASQGRMPLDTLRTLVHCVRGLDLNPLAVISARANYIFAIADLIFALGDDIEIPVYLADAINVPQERHDGILQYTLDTEVEQIRLEIPLDLVTNQVLGKILLKCEEYIKHGRSVSEFVIALHGMSDVAGLLSPSTEEHLADFYLTINDLNMRTPPWDSIWCRIVKNSFSPKGFGKADYIVGNPPWVRWSRLPASYRQRVKHFCSHYGLVSGRGYTGGIETDISTVLVFSAADQWLNPGGRIGILITWTVFKSGSARGFRLGALPDSTGIRVNSIEDLTAIQPFPDANNETGLYLATKVGSATDAVFEDIPCRIWRPVGAARIPAQLPLAQVKEAVEWEEGVASPVASFGSPLFTGTKAAFDSVRSLHGSSPYLQAARRGTVNDLARVYWVRVEKYAPETNRALIHMLRTDELSKAREVEGHDGVWIEADLLFPLLRGRETGRFGVQPEGWYQIIPNRHYTDFESEPEFAQRYPLAYEYFLNYRDLLEKRSTYRRYMKGLPFYSVYCVGGYSFAPHKVVWLEQQDPSSFRAAVVTANGPDATIPNRVIVPDHKLYFATVNSVDEAHYLCAFLNSPPVRTWLGGFLLGKQIGTTIFEFTRVPKFDPADAEHRWLASISAQAHKMREGTKNSQLLSPAIERELERVARRIAALPQ